MEQRVDGQPIFVLEGPYPNPISRTVAASIIDYHQLKVAPTLANDAVQSMMYKSLMVVTGTDDGNKRKVHDLMYIDTRKKCLPYAKKTAIKSGSSGIRRSHFSPVYRPALTIDLCQYIRCGKPLLLYNRSLVPAFPL